MDNKSINHVTVFGGGLMGGGIAQVIAAAGYHVTVIEIDEKFIEKSKKNINENLQRYARKVFKNDATAQMKYVSDATRNLSYSSEIETIVKRTDLVIEAIVENLRLKQELFRKIDKIAPIHTIFTSNTSSLSITEMAKVTKRPDRFGGLHFFNPVPLMKLLEIIRTTDTSIETYDKLKMFGDSIGKTCISCKDTPGFIVNRLLAPLTAGAINMLDANIATTKDIDLGMKLALGHPMGPFELLDMVGLDTTLNIRRARHIQDPTDQLNQPSPIVEKMVSEGKLGVKSGEGFYVYRKI